MNPVHIPVSNWNVKTIWHIISGSVQLLTVINCYAIAFMMHFLSDDGDEAVQVESSAVSAADVVLYGLNIIVPLMTAELLKV